MPIQLPPSYYARHGNLVQSQQRYRYFVQVFSARFAQIIVEKGMGSTAEVIAEFGFRPSYHEIENALSQELGYPVRVDEMQNTQHGEWEILFRQVRRDAAPRRVTNRNQPWPEQKRLALHTKRAPMPLKQVTTSKTTYVEKESRIRYWMQIAAIPVFIFLLVIFALGASYVAKKMFHIRWP